MPRADTPEPDVAVRGPEEGNAGPDENGNAGDDQPLDEARAQEALDGDPAVDVGVLYPIGTQPVHDVAGPAGKVPHELPRGDDPHRLGAYGATVR